MPHNASLPSHRYVTVRGDVLGLPEDSPAVWYGISSTPGRALGCHVLLENGASFSDLPLHYLAAFPPHTWCADAADVQAWDAFGWDVETVAFDYLRDLSVAVLDPRHQATGLTGRYWFTVDWVRNGFSDHPEQHKLVHVVATVPGPLMALPTDRVRWRDASFTSDDPLPRLRRQTELHFAES